MSSKRASVSSPRRASYAACSFMLGALALGSVSLNGCSSDEHPMLPAASAGTAGRSNQQGAAGAADTSTEGGAEPQDSGGANGGALGAQGGAPSSAGVGPIDAAGAPATHEDPGLPLEPCPSDTASAPPSFQGVCSPVRGWAAGTAVAVASGDSPSFLAVTPSELTLLWNEPGGSQPVYFLADREASNGAFGEAQELPFTNLVALSPDGLRLTAQMSNGSLSEATRATREESFGELQPGSYASLDSDAEAHHFMLGEVAISADDRTLYYRAISLDAATPYPLRVSQRSGGEPWPVGKMLQACELKAYAEFGPHPTAISADGLTLFYFDAARRAPRAAFRTSVDADFSWFTDLPGLAGAQPNAACNRLYFSPTTDEAGLLSAARK